METSKTEKSFDAAKMMWEIRNKTSHETANMSFEELIWYIDEKLWDKIPVNIK